ncbi:MAG: hypothetical protein ACTS4T_01075 [Candidatus Hodgkinia cicadicola]
MEVEGPEVRAPGGLFAPIRPFETETMGGLFRQSWVRFTPSAGGNLSADGSERRKNFLPEMLWRLWKRSEGLVLC